MVQVIGGRLADYRRNVADGVEMAAKKKVDWERIEPDWRAGIKSVQQMADEYTELTGISVTRGGINKHFKELGVERDLTAKVQSKSRAIVSAAMVSGKVSIETTATDSQIINTSAIAVATVRIAHRTDINRGRLLVQSLLAEIEKQTDCPELFEKLAELMAGAPENETKEEANVRKVLQESYYKVVGLSGRVDNVKKLVDSLKTLVALERQAFGILDDEPAPPPELTDEQRAARLRTLWAKAKRLEPGAESGTD